MQQLEFDHSLEIELLKPKLLDALTKYEALLKTSYDSEMRFSNAVRGFDDVKSQLDAARVALDGTQQEMSELRRKHKEDMDAQKAKAEDSWRRWKLEMSEIRRKHKEEMDAQKAKTEDRMHKEEMDAKKSGDWKECLTIARYEVSREVEETTERSVCERFKSMKLADFSQFVDSVLNPRRMTWDEMPCMPSRGRRNAQWR